jgi:hypothetical protein
MNDIIATIESAIELAQERSRVYPSRELSLTITKLQEALFWASDLYRIMRDNA